MIKIVKLGLLLTTLVVTTLPRLVGAMTHDRLDEYMMDPKLLEWDNMLWEKKKEKHNPFEIIKHNHLWNTYKINNKLNKAFKTYNYDVNATNADGDTLLHKALASSEVDDDIVLKLIGDVQCLGYGADINLPDHNGDTPLHLAVTTKRSYEVIVKLVEKGANVTAVNKKDKTALDLALANKHKIAPYLALITDFYAVMDNKMSFEKYAIKHLDNNKNGREITAEFALKFCTSCSFMKKLCRPKYRPTSYKIGLSEKGEDGKQKKTNFDFYWYLFKNITEYCKYNLALAYDILVSRPELLDQMLKKSKREYPWVLNRELRDDFIIKLLKKKHALMGTIWLRKKDETARIPLDVINRIVRFIPYTEIGK